MSFLETIAKAKTFLREHGRISDRALKREFVLDDAALDELVDELVEVQQVAVREGRTLAWIGGSSSPNAAPEPAPATDKVLGERRQATVVFSDLSGYTRLNEWLDPEEVESLIYRLKAVAIEVVEAHGGTVNQFVGDEVLALFGIPTAHSDDPLRATHATRELHRRAEALFEALADERARTLRLHTGIATGLVLAMARDDRDGRHGVTGDTVNVAARLRSLAGVDEIWLDEATRQQAEVDFLIEPLAAIQVKDRAEPVSPFRVESLRERVSVRRTSFVGRRRELEEFETAASRVRAGKSGEILYLRGEAGIGKTRLVEECQRIATQQLGLVSHKALVLSFGSGVGRDALRALVWSVLGVRAGDSIERRRHIAREAAQTALTGADAAPSLNDLLDIPQEGEAQSAYAAMNPGTREERLVAAATALVRAASRERPVVLIVEDLHWASETTLRQLTVLAASLRHIPVLLVMTSRIEGDPLDATWRSRLGEMPLCTVDLVGLQPEEAMELAAVYLGGSADVEACIARAEGNPLFLEQLLHSAGASDSSGALPGSVQSVVLARLDRLPQMDKLALQSASVLGQRFSLETLRYLTEQPAYRCEAPLQHYLVRPEGEEWIFSHALIQEGIYESLLHSRARELHRKAAEWYAERDLTLHAQHLDRAGDGRAAGAYLEAADAQLRSYRHDEALALAERALALATTAAERVSAYCLEGEVCNELGSAQDAQRAFEAALEEADTAAQRCRSYLGLATSLRALDRPHDAFPILEVAQREAEGAGLDRDLSELLHLQGNLHFPLGNIDDCLDSHERALSYARRANSPECEARALGGLADGHYVHGRMSLANRYFGDSVKLAREHGLGRIEVANHVMVGWSLMYLDPRRAEEVRTIASEARLLAERVNDPRAKLLSVSLPAWLASEYLSDLQGAEDAWNETAAIVKALGARRFESQVRIGLGRIAYRRGDRPSAKAHFEAAAANCRETGMGFLGPMSLGGLARSEDDPERARAALAEGESAIGAGCVGHNQPNFYRDAIYVFLSQRDWGEAERCARALADFARGGEWPFVEGIVDRAHMLVRYGRGERSSELRSELERLRKAAERGQLWEPAFALMEVG